LKDPHLLPCYHTFCFLCLKDLVNHQTSCPSCRFSLPSFELISLFFRSNFEEEVEKLPKNFLVNNVLNSLSRSQKSLICDHCNESASSHCSTCDECYCLVYENGKYFIFFVSMYILIQIAYKMSKKTNNHLFVSIQEYRSKKRNKTAGVTMSIPKKN